VEKMIGILRGKGLKITPQRRAVLAALADCGKFVTAQRILDYVKKSNPDISLDTIYRNLSLLVELGLVHEIQTRGRDGNVFEVVTDGHHHHLVCVGCGKAQCLDFCPISEGDVAKAEANGFKVMSHSLEFYGYCRECHMAE